MTLMGPNSLSNLRLNQVSTHLQVSMFLMTTGLVLLEISKVVFLCLKMVLLWHLQM